MKNLFRHFASSIANSRSIDKHALNDPQNKHSANAQATFFTTGGDLLQTYEKLAGDILFGAIQIQLRTPYIYLTDSTYVLHRFLGGLQKHFDIVHTTEADYYFSKTSSEHVANIYWQDAGGTDWKVRGWTNGHAIAIRYIKNVNALSVWQEDGFLNLAGRIRG